MSFAVIRCHSLPTFQPRRITLLAGKDISKARTECHRMSCMYETLSSPFLDPLLFLFHLSSFLFPLSSSFPSCSHPFRHLNSCFQFSIFKSSYLLYLKCGQVTYRTGSVVPKVVDVPKWVMPTEMYSARPSTVLAYKKAHQVGRFDPAAPEILEQKIAQMWREIEERGSLDLRRSHHA